MLLLPKRKHVAQNFLFILFLNCDFLNFLEIVSPLFSVREIITTLGQKFKGLENAYIWLGKENVDELFGK